MIPGQREAHTRMYATFFFLWDIIVSEDLCFRAVWHVKNEGVQGGSNPPLWDTGYLNFQNKKNLKIGIIVKNE
jgi:hypothetical protein